MTAAQPATPVQAMDSQQALVNRFCVRCHNGRTRSGGLALDSLDMAQVGEDPVAWEKVVRKLRAGLMPPAGQPRPDEVTYDGFRSWVESELDRAAALHPDPGRTEVFHRLNRTEYQNAVRDLLALEVDATEYLPADNSSYGFDNIAGAGWNALHQAVRTRRPNTGFGTPGPIPTGTLESIEVIKKMIGKGVHVNARMTKDGMKDGQRNRLIRTGATAFLLAAKNTDTEVMRLLAPIASGPGESMVLFASWRTDYCRSGYAGSVVSRVSSTAPPTVK